MIDDLSQLKNLYYRLNILREKKNKNDLKLRVLRKNSSKLDSESKKLDKNIKILEDKKNEINQIPKKIKENTKNIKLFFSISFVVALSICTISIGSGLLTILGIVGVSTLISSLFSISSIYSIIKLKKELKQNSIEDIDNQIKDKKEIQQFNRKEYSENKNNINLIEMDQNTIEQEIKQLLSSVIKYKEIQDKIIEEIINEDDAIFVLKYTLDEEENKNNKQKKIGVK